MSTDTGQFILEIDSDAAVAVLHNVHKEGSMKAKLRPPSDSPSFHHNNHFATRCRNRFVRETQR